MENIRKSQPDATQQNGGFHRENLKWRACVAPMLEKLTLSHCLAYRYFEELDRARQMAGLMQQMANTCVNSIQQRMGTVFA